LAGKKISNRIKHHQKYGLQGNLYLIKKRKKNLLKRLKDSS